MTPCYCRSQSGRAAFDHAPYSGFWKGAWVPEAEVKTILSAEVHAQIFAGSSLQKQSAVIHDRLA
jgi:hypothetical protein